MIQLGLGVNTTSMASSIYGINKGVNRPAEFKGLKAQYIWYLGGGLVGLALDDGGLRVDRDGDPWCIPAGDLRGVEVTSHHAGKEVYADKVLVVDWRLGPATLRSGFVLDEAAAPGWAAALRPLVGGRAP